MPGVGKWKIKNKSKSSPKAKRSSATLTNKKKKKSTTGKLKKPARQQTVGPVGMAVAVAKTVYKKAKPSKKTVNKRKGSGDRARKK